MDEHDSGSVMLKGHPEWQYLNTLREICNTDTKHDNRTGVDTKRILGVMHKYDFEKDGFPLFTTKRTWFKGVAIELLWFLSGSQNIKFMVDNGVHIWNDDAYRVFKNKTADLWKFLRQEPLSQEQFLDRVQNSDSIAPGQFVSKEYVYGDLGPVYGVQWRNWQVPCALDGDSFSIDQIRNLVNGLKNNPTSRRHILSAWNVADIELMGLPPCHVISQFTVDDGKLWCHMYQRSCDMFLGAPFNVASYSLLTYMLSYVCNLEPGGLIHTMHDCHLYTNHIPQATQLLMRTPRPFPQLTFKDLEWKSGEMNIDDFKYEHFQITGYDPYDSIKAKLNTDNVMNHTPENV